MSVLFLGSYRFMHSRPRVVYTYLPVLERITFFSFAKHICDCKKHFIFHHNNTIAQGLKLCAVRHTLCQYEMKKCAMQVSGTVLYNFFLIKHFNKQLLFYKKKKLNCSL